MLNSTAAAVTARPSATGSRRRRARLADTLALRIRTVLAILPALFCLAALGCGQASTPARTSPTSTTAAGNTTTAPAGGATAHSRRASGARAHAHARAGHAHITSAGHATRAHVARSRLASAVAREDASSDAVLAEGKVHIAAGAPSDAEIRAELAAARRAGVVLPSGESAESFERAAAASGSAVAGAEVPQTPWNPRSKPIADWIVPILEWASEHGWTGTVTSGYRTFYEQAQLNAAGDYSAPAGVSNHETTAYPGGAVDVTEPSQLLSVLRSYPGEPKLVGGVLGPIDPEHFSATGD